MEKHKKLLKEKFDHAKEDLFYNSGGDVMWSLFKFESGSVTIYYHDTDEFHIIDATDSKWFSLKEIANRWEPLSREIIE